MNYSQCYNDVLLFLYKNLPTNPDGYVTGTIVKGLNNQYDYDTVNQVLIQLFDDKLIDGTFVLRAHPRTLELGIVREITARGKIYLQQLK